MAPSSQELEPPANPGRFRPATTVPRALDLIGKKQVEIAVLDLNLDGHVVPVRKLGGGSP
jgi:hypothetical protein